MRLLKKRWAGALLSVNCCWFVWIPSWKSHTIWTSSFEEEEERRKEERKHFGCLATFWFSTFTMLVVHH